jgi:hypothetical protein
MNSSVLSTTDTHFKPYGDIPTLSEGTLAERYERTMSKIEQITLSGYKVTVMWECEFDEAGIVRQNLNYSLILLCKTLP